MSSLQRSWDVPQRVAVIGVEQVPAAMTGDALAAGGGENVSTGACHPILRAAGRWLHALGVTDNDRIVGPFAPPAHDGRLKPADRVAVQLVAGVADHVVVWSEGLGDTAHMIPLVGVPWATGVDPISGRRAIFQVPAPVIRPAAAVVGEGLEGALKQPHHDLDVAFLSCCNEGFQRAVERSIQAAITVPGHAADFDRSGGGGAPAAVGCIKS